MKDTINVLIIDGSKFERGGVQKHLLDLVSNLDKNRFRIIYVRRCHNYVTKALSQYENVNIQIIPFNFIINLKAIIKIRKLISDPTSFIIHTHTPAGGVIGRLAALLRRGTKIVHTVHGPAWLDMNDNNDAMYRPSLYKRMKHYIKVKIEGFCDKRSNILITLSNADRETLIRNGNIPKGDFKLIPNGIYLSDIHPSENAASLRQVLGIHDHDKVIVSVGNLTAQKGTKYLVRAAPIVLEKNPNIKFLVVGEGPQLNELLKEVADADVKGNFIFLGRRSDVYDILAISDIFVLPSLWEGLPISLLEAMAMKVPIVTTSVNGCKEVISENEGVVVPPLCHQNIADGILRLIQNQELCRQLSESAYQKVHKVYALSNMIDSVENIYLSLSNKSH